jgi:UDP-galactose transporter B1
MNPVKVITAGGAANNSSKSSSRKPLAQTVQNELDFATKLEMEHADDDSSNNDPLHSRHAAYHDDPLQPTSPYSDHPSRMKQGPPDHHHHSTHSEISHDKSSKLDLIWLIVCFFGIMASFVCYGLLMEYTTSGGRELHELSFLFVTSALYTITAAAGRYVRDETPTTIPPGRFAVLGLTSMGSTFCSVRSLRYVL